MIIFIKNGIKNISITCKKNYKIEYIFNIINKKFDCISNDYWLCYSGKVLLKKYLIGDYLQNESTIDLNWKPLEICKIINGSRIFYVDLRMILKGDIIDISFKYYDNYFNYIIPEKFLNEKILKNWMNLYYINNIGNNVIMVKPIEYFMLKKYFPDSYLNFLNKLSPEDIVNLINLFEYIKQDELHNILCFYISNKLLESEDCELRDYIIFGNYIKIEK